MGLSAQVRAVVTNRVGWLALTFVTDEDEATVPCLQAACQELDRIVSDIIGDRGQGEYLFHPEHIQFVTITTIVDRHIRVSHFGFWPGVQVAGHEAPSSLSVSQREDLAQHFQGLSGWVRTPEENAPRIFDRSPNR